MLRDELQKIIKGEVRTDEETLQKFSHDTSIFQVRPEVVVAPKDREDIKALVRYVSEHKKEQTELSLTARSGGSDMSGGTLGESIILDCAPHLNHFSVDISGFSITTEPGVFFHDFEKSIEGSGMLFAPYPASKGLAAFGGMVMNNCAGEKTLRYGQMRKFVEELKMILSDGEEYAFHALSPQELEEKKKLQTFEGEVYRKTHELLESHFDEIQAARPKVSKNSSGYALWDVWDRKRFDLTHLFTGSQGTLGILTEAKLRLQKEKKYEALISVFFRSWDPLPAIVNAMLPYDPESLEVFDSETLKLGIRFMPEVAKKAGSSFLPFALRFLPEALMGVRLLGLPKIILLHQIAEDSEEEVSRKAEEIRRALSKFPVLFRVMREKPEMDKYWVMRRESFNLLREHVRGKRTAPFIDDFCILPKDIPEFLPQLLAILKEHHIKVNIAGHAGNGNFHIIPLMDFTKESERAKIWPVAEKVFDLVIRYGGSITAEHNDGLVRSPYLKKMYGEKVYGLFEEVKKIFDPQGIFNPGKKTGSSLEYAMEHLWRG
ncbi:MAG: FAD-binding oxidoreductase [Nanoarchaeota archaeon]|nr:FAD-binding oxidoreductase [Nanoarchaeota archaeon]